MDYESAEKLVKEYIKSKSLLNHVKAVEVSMRFYANKFEEDETLWAITGLLHDLDYEKYPDKHPKVAETLLAELDTDPSIIQAIRLHATKDPENFPTKLDKALWACDEITGFITAVTLVRPSRKLDDLKVDSVKKKMKDKAFARPVSRDDLKKGAEVLGISLEEHIENVIEAMNRIAPELGL